MIKVYLLAKSTANDSEIQKWISDLGAEGWEYPDKETDGTIVTGVAAKRCYNSFQPGMNPNVTKVRECWVDYIENILSSGHGSVLEHVSYTFAIEGVSRVFTAEMNRHRAGVAISEASMRYIRFDSEIPYWAPRDITMPVNPEEKRTKEVFDDVFSFIAQKYKELCEIWDIENKSFHEKKRLTSLFRRIVPQGVCTGGVWTLNMRALRHVLTLRSSPHAEEEIVEVMSMIGKIMLEQEPLLFQDFQLIDGYYVPVYKKV